MVFAVAGAMSIRSAHSARSMCQVFPVTVKALRSGNVPTMTSCPERVEYVRGEMNSLADSVITTRTSAPALRNSRMTKHTLYAAMPPVTPMRIFFPFNIHPRRFSPYSVSSSSVFSRSSSLYRNATLSSSNSFIETSVGFGRRSNS
jgi:hypothetical protein